MGALALGVVLIIGYFYQSQHPYRRLSTVRSTGYHIYFKAGFSGLVFLFLALATWVLIDLLDLPSTVVERYPNEAELTYLKANVSDWHEIKGAFVLFLAFIYCLFYVQLQKFRSSKISVFKQLKSVTNDLEKLVISATVEVKPIRVELSCGKVYVGLPETPNLEHGEVTYITLLPLLSGYIDETKNLIFNNNYYLHYEEYYHRGESSDHEHDTIDKFSIVIPVSEITVASQFSIDAFMAFRNAKESELVGKNKPADLYVD